MEYAAMTFWLLVIVFTALAVHQLWNSLVQPKVVNSVLLPGTLVAQLGYVLGLLITGGTVNDTALIKDDDSGEPKTGPEPKPKIPLIGTIIIALLPMIGCAAAIYWSAQYFGQAILPALGEASVARELPLSVKGWFALVYSVLGLVEALISIIRSADLSQWPTLVFLYLAICLSVRMAPLTGNIRGALGAIFLTGLLAFIAGQMFETDTGLLSRVWPLITFSLAMLLLLLIISLLFKGAIHLVKVVAGNE